MVLLLAIAMLLLVFIERLQSTSITREELVKADTLRQYK